MLLTDGEKSKALSSLPGLFDEVLCVSPNDIEEELLVYTHIQDSLNLTLSPMFLTPNRIRSSSESDIITLKSTLSSSNFWLSIFVIFHS